MHRLLCAMALASLASLASLGACKPGGVGEADKLCAKAAAMYAKCESSEGMSAQDWELVIDRWRGLCRAVMTGETKQLLPDALSLWEGMSDEVKLALREQAECTAQTATCSQYTACEK